MDCNKRNKRITSVVVILIILAGIIAIALAAMSDKPSEPPRPYVRVCNLTNISPKVGERRNITASNSNKAIANFDGYLYYDSPVGRRTEHLPLDFKSMTYKEKHNVLTLDAECASIDIQFISNRKNVKVDMIKIYLNSSSRGNDTCVISGPQLSASADKHICTAFTFYKCSTKSDEALTLMVNRLEFEINADIDDVHKKGQYVTPAMPCFTS